jgi:putative copper resistance protein D
LSPEAALGAIRAVHFCGVALLLGTLSFRAYVAPGAAGAALSPRLRSWERWALGCSLATAVLWIPPAAAIAADGWEAAVSPSTVMDLLAATWFGQVWMPRLVLGAAIGLALWRAPVLVSAFAAALFAGSLGLVGHGVMHDGALGAILSGCLCVHGIATAVWLGSLPALLLALRLSPADAAPEAMADLLLRYSALGRTAVMLVLFTGFVGGHVLLHGWMHEPTGIYGVLLLVKVGLVLLMLCLAAFNRFALTPRVRTTPAATLRGLSVSVATEALLGLTVLGLIAVAGELSPMPDA